MWLILIAIMLIIAIPSRQDIAFTAVTQRQVFTKIHSHPKPSDE